uniref:Bm11908 n=1 Tax=Brugia malayi TaxID=6279 RepID=A0A1I9G9Y4_BRUMA|nr:Bm11908 [Brugia malayi]
MYLPRGPWRSLERPVILPALLSVNGVWLSILSTAVPALFGDLVDGMFCFKASMVSLLSGGEWEEQKNTGVVDIQHRAWRSSNISACKLPHCCWVLLSLRNTRFAFLGMEICEMEMWKPVKMSAASLRQMVEQIALCGVPSRKNGTRGGYYVGSRIAMEAIQTHREHFEAI